MDRNTIIAVVLAVIVIVGGMFIQNKFFPSPQPTAARTSTAQPAPTPAPAGQAPQAAAAPASGPVVAAPVGSGPVASGQVAAAAEELREDTYALETDLLRVQFTNRGGEVTSIQLKAFKNLDGTPVEMVFRGDSGANPFSVHFGDYSAPPVDALFRIEPSLTGKAVSFVRTFASASGVPFTLRKTYVLADGDYMIELRISLENSVNDYLGLNFNGLAYTLGVGPQIGPPFAKLDKRNEFRFYHYYATGAKKSQTARIPKEGYLRLGTEVRWAAIVGKYFELITVPPAGIQEVVYDTRAVTGLKDRSSLYFGRPEIKSSRNEDTFRFYVGPKKREILQRYNDAEKNAYKLADQRFEETISSSVLIHWLAEALRFVLEQLYRLIPNYGVAIILLTLLIKILFYPLTRKSFESTARMQALQPKMAELRAKYKNNPQKLNQETAALYKREGVNPLGGCLPLLLQLPIFFALYNLLISHFELRGAMFIPGWIPDLSEPEAIFRFPAVNILSLSIDALRALPFLMLITTFLQTRLTQAPDSSAQANMKMMTYAMPIVFFFILYNMPSGLLLYWTVQNVLSILQQMYTNSRRRRAEAGGALETGQGK